MPVGLLFAVAIVLLAAALAASAAASVPGHQGLIVFNGDRADINTIRTDGSDLNRLTTSVADESTPAWSPNGRRVVYCAPQPVAHGR
jgi:hypothetical protein